MNPRDLGAINAQLSSALDELDAKVTLCRELGYPMPEGNSRRTEREIELLELAEAVLYAPDEDACARAKAALAEAIRKEES